VTGKLYFNWAWGRLLIVLAAVWVAAYLLFLGIFSVTPLNAEGVLHVASGGVRNVSLPIVEAGMKRGVPMGLMLFAVNFSVSVVFILLLVASPLLDPEAKEKFPSYLRKMVTRNTAMDKPLFWLLGFLPSFRELGHEDLRAVTVWLNVAPAAAMIILGIELGAVTAAVQKLSGSLLYSGAMLLPHCVVELPALCLAGSLPFGAYRSLREQARNGAVTEFFAAVREMIRLRGTRLRIALVPVLLLLAGVIESEITLPWIRGGS
jgi:hypothetical protein